MSVDEMTEYTLVGEKMINCECDSAVSPSSETPEKPDYINNHIRMEQPMPSLQSFTAMTLTLLLTYLIFWDSMRNFKMFLRNAERKFLVLHSVKLCVYGLMLNLAKTYFVYYTFITAYIIALLLVFFALLSMRQVEIGIEEFKGLRNSGFKTFRYDGLAGNLIYLFAAVSNLTEFHKSRKIIEKKSRELVYIAIFPVQKYIAVSITGVEFTPRKTKFISAQQLEEIDRTLLPGDILLKRNDWQATNLGIDGFWTHTGIYLGHFEKLDMYFDDLKPLKGRRFSEYLKETYPVVYEKIRAQNELKVIEAIEEGVSVKALDNIAKVDYFSALRPNISKEKKLQAVMNAISYIGKPYDYHFDIESDDAFICTEVIKKAFSQSVQFEMKKRFGRWLLLPNGIAEKYSRERKTKQHQLEFVLFYDLSIKSLKAFRSTEKEFSKTPMRDIRYYRKRDIIRYLSTIVPWDTSEEGCTEFCKSSSPVSDKQDQR